jgi:hypothetical protein
MAAPPEIVLPVSISAFHRTAGAGTRRNQHACLPRAPRFCVPQRHGALPPRQSSCHVNAREPIFFEQNEKIFSLVFRRAFFALRSAACRGKNAVCCFSNNSHLSNSPFLFSADAAFNMSGPADSAGLGEASMDELVGRLVANVGVDRPVAEKAVGIILDFLVKEGPADKVQPLIARLPGADALLQSSAASDEGGMFTGGIMGAGTRMMAAGLTMSQVQAVTREVIAYTREKAGEDAVGEIVGAVPGLAQFV